MLAKKTAEEQDAYEPVFVNADSIITECAIRNIFFIKDNMLLTPHTNLGVLPGVMRDTIMVIAQSLKLEVSESHIVYSEINTMDEAFISSTGIGLLPCVWNGWTSNHTITLKLMSKLQELIDNIP
jgi:branched-chain amino acid aminotransferase